MMGEKGFTNKPNDPEDPKKIPEFILAAIRKANETISIGAAAIPEDENQYVDMVLKAIPSSIRNSDAGLESLVRNIINEKNVGRIVRKSGSADNKDHGASIDHMIEQGGEAPPEIEKDFGVADLSKSGDLKKDGNYADRMSDHEYFLAFGEHREK